METYIVALALVIFLGLVWWKGRHAIIGGLDSKIAQIRAEIDEASRLREEAELLYAKNSKLVEDADETSKGIVQQAREEAERGQRNSVESFETSAERRREQATAKIAQAELEAVRAVRAESTIVAMMAARTIIKEDLTDDQRSALVDAAIAEIPDRLG